VGFEVQPTSSPTTAEQRAALTAVPSFGRVFTDHMVTIRYADGRGWHDARVHARAPIPMDPATAVLHYAQEIFEGTKAYRAHNGGITLFRADANARRFQSSARRLAMQPLPTELFLGSIRELLKVDHDWVPTDTEGSLYLRPFMYASEIFLGVKPSAEYMYVLIASPVGSYFKGGLKPVTAWVSAEYTRAAPGGTGAAKCGGNYAASLAAHTQARENGCDEVVFVDAVHRRYVEEMGGMNIFFVYDGDTLVTPPSSGTILPGITRDSVITLGRAAGYRVEERLVSVDEWQADATSGRIREAFACGTAAVITPISEVRSADGVAVMSDGEIGPITSFLRKSLVDIQRGSAPDPYGWIEWVVAPPKSRARSAKAAPAKATPAEAAATKAAATKAAPAPAAPAKPARAAAKSAAAKPVSAARSTAAKTTTAARSTAAKATPAKTTASKPTEAKTAAPKTAAPKTAAPKTAAPKTAVSKTAVSKAAPAAKATTRKGPAKRS
jgi:branched-chain amino acid aminotransferase